MRCPSPTQQLAATLYRSPYLSRRSTADMVAGIHRAFQGKHLEHVLLDLVAEAAQFVQAHLGQVLAAVHAVLHRMPDDFMAVAEGDAFAYQIVGQVGGGGEAA